MRHRLDLRVGGGVFVRKVLINDLTSVGVGVESGGEVFNVEPNRVVLSAGIPDDVRRRWPSDRVWFAGSLIVT